MPEWTSDQKKAISSRDGTILVSAAAGSGKTAVLVERVIQRLMDEKKPCSADKLLIVTFTRAATQQMKDRIYQAITKKLKDEPSNAHLKRQLMLLPFAHISTIDSFCNDIVKDNFQQVNVSPDYKMLDNAELKIMKADAVDSVMNTLYKENSDEFNELSNLLTSGADDSNLSDLIIKIFDNSMAFAQPDKWLDSLLQIYESKTDGLRENAWGKIIISQAKMAVEYCSGIADKMETKMLDDEVVSEKYNLNILEIKQTLESLTEVLKNGKWDEIRDKFMSVSFSNLARLPKGYSSQQADFIKAQKSNINEVLKKKTAPYFCASEKENVQDMEYLEPLVKKLIEAVKLFQEEFNKLKSNANGVDFSDITHLALSLLVTFDDSGTAHKTKLAESMTEKFDEILVDEYQDINEIQNSLFSAVSNNDNNIFMVGDVKQSIYRFRQAMPEIFIRRRDSFEPFNGDNYPARINLGKNFRSRSGVTNNINFIFSQLMSKNMGSIDYNEDEQLVAAADYEECNYPQTELHIVGKPDETTKVSREIEAQHIADTIKEIMDEKMQVKDKDGYRDVCFRDITILMRSVGNGKAEIYAKTLAANNIPVYVSTKSDFFATAEISTMLSLMRVIDNPIQDVPLLSVMLSPIYGFTPDELAKMRIQDRKKPLYHCLLNCAENGDKKSKNFLSLLDNLRMLSSTLSCTEFVRELFETTGYTAIVTAMRDGESRLANLNLLLEYASKYEDAGHRGISGFVRFIDRVRKRDEKLESNSEISETADVVKIMTIHKSKGLEFPVCIIADLNNKFNNDNIKGISAFHPTCGLCFDIRDNKRKVRYPSVGKKALMIAENRSGISEELRVLYVAMTRAKERLICVTRYDNLESRLVALSADFNKGTKLSEYMISTKTCMADWVLSAFIRHPAMKKWLSYYKIEDIEQIESSAELKIVYSKDNGITDVTASESEKADIIPDEKLVKKIEEYAGYVYPYAELSSIRAKSAPSEFDSEGFNSEYFASAKPQFLSKSGMNPANRGTATHKFMEFYDYNASQTVKEQIDVMIHNHRLTDDEAKVLETEKLEKFFNGEIAQRIKKSTCLLREKRVTVGIAAGELYQGLSEKAADEKVLIQGFVDCAFYENDGYVIVDYKTDRGVSMEELRQKYSTQLKMYERALGECTGEKVNGTLIYSFENGTYINL